jgi:hypothetical protein
MHEPLSMSMFASKADYEAAVEKQQSDWLYAAGFRWVQVDGETYLYDLLDDEDGFALRGPVEAAVLREAYCTFSDAAVALL